MRFNNRHLRFTQLSRTYSVEDQLSATTYGFFHLGTLGNFVSPKPQYEATRHTGRTNPGAGQPCGIIHRAIILCTCTENRSGAARLPTLFSCCPHQQLYDHAPEALWKLARTKPWRSCLERRPTVPTLNSQRQEKSDPRGLHHHLGTHARGSSP